MTNFTNNNGLSELENAAALSDWIYRRSKEDFSVDLKRIYLLDGRLPRKGTSKWSRGHDEKRRGTLLSAAVPGVR